MEIGTASAAPEHILIKQEAGQKPGRRGDEHGSISTLGAVDEIGDVAGLGLKHPLALTELFVELLHQAKSHAPEIDGADLSLGCFDHRCNRFEQVALCPPERLMHAERLHLLSVSDDGRHFEHQRFPAFVEVLRRQKPHALEFDGAYFSVGFFEQGGDCVDQIVFSLLMFAERLRARGDDLHSFFVQDDIEFIRRAFFFFFCSTNPDISPTNKPFQRVAILAWYCFRFITMLHRTTIIKADSDSYQLSFRPRNTLLGQNRTKRVSR